MEQMALPGSVLMTAGTFSLAKGFICVKPLGPLLVKGLGGPCEVYEVVGVESVRSRLHVSAARGLTRFVGRDPELEQLRVALDRAKAGHGQVVAVVGEPGVGKSRLYWEFVHSHRTEGCLVLESRSVSYGQATSYLPVIDLLKGYFALETRDDPRRLREKVTGRLLTLDESLRPTLRALLALLDLAIEDQAWQALDPAQRRQKTLEAMKRLLLRESEEQPLVLVFEDLHWIDSQTQAVLDALVDSLPTARILLLVNYRPEYQHAWGSKGVYQQIRIDPLPVASADDLLTDLLGVDSAMAALKRRLIDRTHGNPFFLEESVRALLETGALVGERGVYRLVRPLEETRVPATVQVVLAARIDRLPAEDKRLLQSAAVIGKDVPGPLLQAIAKLPEADLRRSLAALQAAEFLYETRLYPEHEYTFKHALTHEVAYEGVLHERRRALHARIAETIEGLHGDRLAEQVDRLAHHTLRGEAWEKAAGYLRTAGIRAMERSAYREAIPRLEEALGALAHLPDTCERTVQEIDAYVDLNMALRAVAELGHLIDHLNVAKARAESIGDHGRLGLVLANMATALFVLGEHERAVEVGREALVIGTAAGEPGVQAISRFALGVAYHALGEYEQAIPLLRENSAVLNGAAPERFGLERFGLHYLSYLTVASHTWLVYCLSERGEFAEAIARAGDGMAIAERVGHLYSRLVALDGLAFAHLMRGDHGLAIPLLERGLALCRESHILLWDPDFVCGLGYGYALRGEAADVLPQVERSVHEQESLGQKNTLAFWMTWLSEAYLSLGRHDDARQTVSRALALARERHQRGVQAICRRLESEVTMQAELSDPDRADRQYREALLLATELGMRPLVAHCHLGLGQLYRRTGDGARAREHLTTAGTMYREMAMRFWLARAQAALGPN
jgi:tetratricopeptide (TPR) repeat protein